MKYFLLLALVAACASTPVSSPAPAPAPVVSCEVHLPGKLAETQSKGWAPIWQGPTGIGQGLAFQNLDGDVLAWDLFPSELESKVLAELKETGLNFTSSRCKLPNGQSLTLLETLVPAKKSPPI